MHDPIKLPGAKPRERGTFLWESLTTLYIDNNGFLFLSDAVGKHKAHVISACRQAIKSNNVNGLFKIIKAGTL